MNKREILKWLSANAALAAWPPVSRAQTAADLPDLLRAGSCVVLLRHAQTEAGIGDPPNFALGQCSTQRNLSDEGREQAKRIGQWFNSHNLQPRSVQSSAWCRCKDTAKLAFGKSTELPSLNSTFETRTNPDAQTKALRARLRGIPANQFEVWVTHQVNITSLTGEATQMGEALVVNSKGYVITRTLFSG